MAEKEKSGLNISVRSFVIAVGVIFALMVLTYVLTFLVPGGQYSRIINENGNSIIDTASEFRYVDGGISFVRWVLSPLLVLAAPGSATLIAVIVFLLVIGGVFAALDQCGMMKYMLDRLTARFGKTRYRFLAVVMLFFMSMGSLVGSFEECVPLVPIVVALSIGLGWDAITGIAMSLLACGCGFAAGVFNPFSVGVAQTLAGLPMFSGAGLRAVAFVLIYGLLLLCVCAHAKRIERAIDVEKLRTEFTQDSQMDRSLRAFAVIIGFGIALVLLSSVITVLQDYTLIIVALMFLAAGIVSPQIAGMGWKSFGKTFRKGLVGILPAVLMILMASSIRFTLEEAKVLDTVLHGAVDLAETMPPFAVVLFIYLIVLVMNFFVASGSAKAFMLIPLIVPLAQVFGISPQLCVMAYAFGDGFSNVFYPTNPALLISLGLVDVDYGTWFKWSWKFQAANLMLTSAMLLFALAIGYGQ